MSPHKFSYGNLLKIEWLVADVRAVGFPDRAERAIWGVILAGYCFANLGRICGQGTTCRCT